MNINKQILLLCLDDEELMDIDHPAVQSPKIKILIKKIIKYIRTQLGVINYIIENHPNEDTLDYLASMVLQRTSLFSPKLRNIESILEEGRMKLLLRAAEIAQIKFGDWDSISLRKKFIVTAFCIQWSEHLWDMYKIFPPEKVDFLESDPTQDLFFKICEHVLEVEKWKWDKLR